MKNRSVRKMLTTMLSAAMIIAQIGKPICVMAEDAYIEDMDTECEDETFEDDETEDVEVDLVEPEIDVIAEYDESERVELSENDLIPPTDIKWVKPGVFKFKPATSKDILYFWELYKDGKHLCTWVKNSKDKMDITEDGYYSYNVGDRFNGSGTYTLKVYVSLDDHDDSVKKYASEIPEISWTEPKQRIATPGNPHWEYRDSKHNAVAVCDPVENSYYYTYYLYRDGTRYSINTTTVNELNFTSYLEYCNGEDLIFSVIASSNDLTKYANSLKSVESAVWDPNKAVSTPITDKKEDETPKWDLPSNTVIGNTFPQADAEAGVTAYDIYHTLRLDTDKNGNFVRARILKKNGLVDDSIDSYIANIVTEYNDDGTPKTFYSLVFRNGEWDTDYDTSIDGLYTFQGEEYSAAGGTVNLSVNGLTYTGDIDGWKYLALGHVVKNQAGLVAYGPEDNLRWFWIDSNGSCDTEYNAIVKRNGAEFLVHGGILRTDYTGFTYDPQNKDVWYHITNGQVWGEGEITDISIEGGEITRNCVNGTVIN